MASLDNVGLATRYEISRVAVYYSKDELDLRFFGAVSYTDPDAAVDSTGAIQAALDAVNEGGDYEGVPLRVRGKYMITDGLTYTQAAGVGTHPRSLVMRGNGGYQYNQTTEKDTGDFIWLNTVSTGKTMLFIGKATGVGTDQIHTGPVIEHIGFRGNGDESANSRALHLSGVNRWAIQNCSWRDVETGLYVDDDGDTVDSDWGIVHHCMANDVKHSVWSTAGLFINGGGHHASQVLAETNLASYSSTGQTLTITLAAADAAYVAGDAVEIYNATDSDADGIYTVITRHGDTSFDVLTASDKTSFTGASTGTARMLGSAIKCENANIKILGARISGGGQDAQNAYAVGVHAMRGPVQIVGNGIEGAQAGVLVDSAASGDNAKRSIISGNLISGKAGANPYFGVVLGANTLSTNTAANSYVSNTTNYVDRALSDSSLGRNMRYDASDITTSIISPLLTAPATDGTNTVQWVYDDGAGNQTLRVTFPNGQTKDITTDVAP